jgi:multidrug resistance efflux pump
MSEPIQGSETDPRELEEFDQEALHARRRQYLLAAAATAIVAAAVVAIPWQTHVQAGGRVAPERWARVHSEAPGVVREVTRKSGDAVEAGDVIAVLDFDEQRDALEAARLAAERERQKLADLELRVHENAIQREGADAVVQLARERAAAAERIDGSRIDGLDSFADATLDGVRSFTAHVRAELAMNRSARATADFNGESLYRKVRGASEHYSEYAATVAANLVEIGGPEAGRQFSSQLEDLHFTYALADHSMEEILEKRGLVTQGVVPAMVLRELNVQLERETLELAHGFRAVSGSARTLLGSRAEQNERVRAAEEIRRLLESESERIEAQRAGVASEIATADLAVRAAERHQGKTAIRAPIRGTLAGESLSQFDPVSANAAVGMVEDTNRLVLKLRVSEADARRIKVGQAVDARASSGRALHGSVFWSTPLAGQEVRDQAWNVLIELEGDNAGVELGDKVTASIDMGRRSLLERWFGPSDEIATLPRFAFVEDPTEVREPTGDGPVPRAAVQAQLASEQPSVRDGAHAN